MKISLILIALATIFFSQNTIAQNVGIGISMPLTKLHIQNGASGAVPYSLSSITVESDNHTFINFLSPAAKETGLLFGIPGIPYDGTIIYNNTNTLKGLQFRTNGNLTRMVIDSVGNVGIGIAIPKARLHVTDSTVLFSAIGDVPGTTGKTSISGAGRRMMWVPSRAAFRVGYIGGVHWDTENIGIYSFASGYNTIASGIGATALGFETTTSGGGSTAMGYNTIASGLYTTAMGQFTTASGIRSTAMGFYTTASGNSSTAMGSYVSTNNNPGSFVYGDISPFAFTNSTASNQFMVRSAGGYVFYSDALMTAANTMAFNNGQLGIGNNSPNAPLAFANATGRKISLYDGGLNNYYGLGVESGQLQIYTDGAGAKISFGYYTAGTFAERMYLNNSSGILTVNGTNYPSDARYKKQISLLQNPIQKIMAIKGVEYFMRTDEFPAKHFDTKLQVGLIAQDVEKVLPQAVQTDSEGYKSVDYAKVVPLLIEGMKEQQKQIEELKLLVQKLMK